jgi:hypothetical protein
MIRRWSRILLKLDFPTHHIFLDEKCKLQKDRNKGEPVGSEICAFGKRACLEKLRQKMELLTQVAMGKSDTDPRTRKKASASMKKGKRRVSEETPLYTETRSIIELRYGVPLDAIRNFTTLEYDPNWKDCHRGSAQNVS